MKLQTYIMLSVLTIAAALVMPEAVQGNYIPAGWDYFSTDHGSVVMPGVGTVQLQGFAWPGPPDPTLLFPLPPGALPPVRRWIEVQWRDQHGNVVGPESKHKVSQLILEHEELVPYFDTIVSRNAALDITGVGASVVIPIEIVWLSLKSIEPIIDVRIPFPCDLYVGLHVGGQIEGKTKFVSATECGNSGSVDIGLRGVTPDDPVDPDFLGLPVTYDVLFIPHGMDPIPSNVVHREESLQAIFHGDTMFASGEYRTLIPEPSGLMTVALSVCGLVLRRGRKRWAARQQQGTSQQPERGRGRENL
jgi:hypothetical protein